MPSTLQLFKTRRNGWLQFSFYYRMLTGLPIFYLLPEKISAGATEKYSHGKMPNDGAI